MQFSTGFSGLITQVVALKMNNIALKLYFDFMSIPDDIAQGSRTIGCTEAKDYEIEFKNVSFKYPNTEKYILDDLSFKIKAGQSLAIVGVNGSGKTTMIKLLLRLYMPTKGVITLNGIDIHEYRYDEYISLFGVVFQDFHIFSFNVGQNVSANTDYDENKATKCLEEAGMMERAALMPNGLQSCLYNDFDEEGIEISGGEAQKIALARAFYKDAPFLVLDEPTAALDPIAEYEVYSKVNDLKDGKNIIYISHRLSSCRFCDCIAVFHEGKLVQMGNHETLVADESGKYYELWNAQAQYYSAE